MTTRVLQVVYGLGMGGAETWLLSLLEKFHLSGEVQIDFLVTCGEPRVFDQEAVSKGANVYYVKYSRSDILRFSREVRKICKERNYSAVHDHQDIQSGFHFVLSGMLGCPVRISHFHNAISHLKENYGTSFSRRLTVDVGRYLVKRLSTHIFGTSRQLLLDNGFEIGSDQRRVCRPLYCGFDVEHFRSTRKGVCAEIRREFSWSSKSKIILIAGRLDYGVELGDPLNQKNTAFALDLIIEFLRRRRDVVALFAGASSPALPVLQRRVFEAGLEGRVVFAGIRKDISDLMAASNLLLFPSQAEGLGMVAVEAQAAGLPVIASEHVPRECEVVDGLVQFLPIKVSQEVWLNAVNNALDMRVDRIRSNDIVMKSHFGIDHSFNLLSRLYRSGSL